MKDKNFKNLENCFCDYFAQFHIPSVYIILDYRFSKYSKMLGARLVILTHSFYHSYVSYVVIDRIISLLTSLCTP